MYHYRNRKNHRLDKKLLEPGCFIHPTKKYDKTEIRVSNLIFCINSVSYQKEQTKMYTMLYELETHKGKRLPRSKSQTEAVVEEPLSQPKDKGECKKINPTELDMHF